MTEVLRPGVLGGVRVVVGDGEFGGVVRARVVALGAVVIGGSGAAGEGGPPSGSDPTAAGEGDVDLLVFDGSAGGARAVLDGAWDAIRSVAAGVVVLVAPRPGGAEAEAARAGLENLARTLSIEWAPRGVRPVAVCPGAGTPAEDVAELVAFLASPAGGYYSGCRFDFA